MRRRAKTKKEVVELEGIKKMVGDLLKIDLDLDKLDRDGVSKASGDDATSFGVSTMNLASPRNLAKTHRERKVENMKLRNKIAKQQEKIEEFRRVDEELRA